MFLVLAKHKIKTAKWQNRAKINPWSVHDLGHECNWNMLEQSLKSMTYSVYEYPSCAILTQDQLPVPDVYLRQNTARVRDVELLTGLTLFDGVGSSFHRSKLLTYLTEDLWPKLSWMDVDGDCPNLSNTNCPAKSVFLRVFLCCGHFAKTIELSCKPEA